MRAKEFLFAVSNVAHVDDKEVFFVNCEIPGTKPVIAQRKLISLSIVTPFFEVTSLCRIENHRKPVIRMLFRKEATHVCNYLSFRSYVLNRQPFPIDLEVARFLLVLRSDFRTADIYNDDLRTP